eukprot:TRINITY_DN361_c0_g1_i1.p1 TRINITY_DN361_c0_g1~~TRINITY_DN361_c0_g1_i1.p1  ORF type:complete len:101 (-),score=15.72 TRINITY_DN361_c0_g1_i1:124-426(-)
MICMQWIPIQDDKIKDTQWKYISDSDIVIPDEFEELFCFKKSVHDVAHKDQAETPRLLFNQVEASCTLSTISGKRQAQVAGIFEDNCIICCGYTVCLVEC